MNLHYYIYIYPHHDTFRRIDHPPDFSLLHAWLLKLQVKLNPLTQLKMRVSTIQKHENDNVDISIQRLQ
jgi:hypothetical protein